jgi:hypothetical protein
MYKHRERFEQTNGQIHLSVREGHIKLKLKMSDQKVNLSLSPIGARRQAILVGCKLQPQCNSLTHSYVIATRSSSQWPATCTVLTARLIHHHYAIIPTNSLPSTRHDWSSDLKNLDLLQSHSLVLNITRSIRMSILGRTVIQTDRVKYPIGFSHLTSITCLHKVKKHVSGHDILFWRNFSPTHKLYRLAQGFSNFFGPRHTISLCEI